MTKATYKRKCLVWASQLQWVRVHDHHGGAGPQTDRHGAGVVAESLHIDPQHETQLTGNGLGF